MPHAVKQLAQTQIILSLTEREAAVLNTVLYDTLDFASSPEMGQLANELDALGVGNEAVTLTFNGSTQMFEAD